MEDNWKFQDKEEELKALIESSTQKFLGVTIDELNKDISSNLTKHQVFNFKVDPAVPFKKAKKEFKAQYLKRMLELNYGNISLVAKKIDVNRRTLHRMLNESDIKLKEIRDEMIKPQYFKQEEINSIITDVLSKYKEVIHPTKLDSMYKNMSEISRSVVDSLPDELLSLKDAETDFEKRYFQEALLRNNFNVSLTAKQIKIRVETLFRKMKQYGIYKK